MKPLLQASMAHKIKYKILNNKLIHKIQLNTTVHEMTASCFADWCHVIGRGTADTRHPSARTLLEGRSQDDVLEPAPQPI